LHLHARTTRLAGLGATVALAAGTVLVAAPAADAKPITATRAFTCATDFGDQTFPVTTKVVLPASVKKGATVPGKAVTMQVVIPEGLAGAMSGIGIESLKGSASGVAAKVGSTKVPVNGVKFPATKVPASGDMKINAKGKAASFKISKPGTYGVLLPKKFKFTAVDQDGNTLLDNAVCSLNAGEAAKIGTLKVTK
jgi:hypothetical protein